MTQQHTLSAREAVRIAAFYGISLRHDRKVIAGNLEQARRYDGAHGKSARQYFDGYMAETARVDACESAAARDFERAAYGGRD